MSPEALRRRALAIGGTLEIGGQTINASGQKIAVKRPAQDAAPAPAGDALSTIAEIMAINARVSATQAETVHTLISQLSALVKPQAPNPVERIVEVKAPRVMPIRIDVVRDERDGRAINLAPVYGEVGDDELADLETLLDARGLVTAIVPRYSPVTPN